MTQTTQTLLTLKSQHQVTALSTDDITQYLPLVSGWALQENKLCKTFAFHDYYDTLAFLNAMAYIVHAEDHHPELTVTYNRCVVKFDTHSVNEGRGGLSINDFICAAKVDALFHQQFS